MDIERAIECKEFIQASMEKAGITPHEHSTLESLVHQMITEIKNLRESDRARKMMLGLKV